MVHVNEAGSGFAYLIGSLLISGGDYFLSLRVSVDLIAVQYSLHCLLCFTIQMSDKHFVTSQNLRLDQALAALNANLDGLYMPDLVPKFAHYHVSLQ